MFKKKDDETPATGTRDMSSIYKSTVYTAGSNRPKMVIYECERCMTMITVTDISEEEATELFDFKQIVGAVMCPKCRQEFETLKTKAYKVSVDTKFQHERGTLREKTEDCVETQEQAWEFVAQTEVVNRNKALEMGYRIVDRIISIEYIPFSDRRA